MRRGGIASRWPAAGSDTAGLGADGLGGRLTLLRPKELTAAPRPRSDQTLGSNRPVVTTDR
ncbi:MAG TPA: hypothetical protein VG142_03525 [Trebonia sp.]|nr:hypothetical protein [Trebonia sp.]